MSETEGGQIRVSIDSGANIHSRNEHFVDVKDLGFDSREEWDSATDERKSEAVAEYWNANGYPEISWEE